ncbi:hypothetical protein VE02_09070 [Pseudogymnoascus sp. 03VT05]|nr:hypothetical protein VE02_09070 [Pseudogymnoascus sp. 03VT05]
MGSLLKGSAFLTGAGSGIGRATALAFAEYGVTRLSLADHDSSSLSATFKLIKGSHSAIQILEHHLDVTDEEKVRTAIAKTARQFGRIDVTVNVAGISHNGLTHNCKTEEWRKVLGVNLDGLWFCQREEIRQMLAQEDRGPREGRGSIVNISSVAGLVGGGISPAYTASKHAVIGLTKNDASTYALKGIRINAVCPGWTATPMVKRFRDQFPDKVKTSVATVPMGRMAEMEEVADVIVFLGSRMRSFVCGAAVAVDGGFTAI